MLDANGKLLKTRKGFVCTVCTHLVLCFSMSPHCVRAIGIHRALALFGGTIQAMGKEKSGPVGVASVLVQRV